MKEPKKLTIRIPVELWKSLRRAQEDGQIESIQTAAIAGLEMIIKKTKDKKAVE